MNFKFLHNNFNVLDMERSIKFYEEALDLRPVRELKDDNGSYRLVYLGDRSGSPHKLELTYLRDWKIPYDLGDNEFHLAMSVDDYAAAYAKHEAMGCICFDNKEMGIYFISDPDGYWIEIVPEDF